MAERKRRGRLFFKFLFVLLLVSLGPLAVAGYYMLSLSKNILVRSTLAGQQTLTIGLADTVYNYVNNFRNVLFDAARLDEFQRNDLAAQTATLNRLIKVHAPLLELSIIDAAGAETARASSFPLESKVKNYAQDPVFVGAMKTGEYIGSLERYQGQYPALTIGIQIISAQTGRAAGVLRAKINLTGLSSILHSGFPDTSRTQAAVLGPEGFLVAHSNMELVFKPDSRLPREVMDILLGNTAREGSGEIALQDGRNVLGAFAEVDKLDWRVYIQQPMDVVDKASSEMLAKTLRALAIVMVFVLFLSYVVTLIIVQPITALREAATMLGQGQFEDLPEIHTANDEIGDLAHTFVQMSESLKIKTVELLSAKDELEKLNRSLESRVEARTRELKAALDELIKKERLAAIGQMASVVGHEIRNPLAVINNSAFFIKTKLGAAGDVDPKIAKHLSIIESEIQQANGIINEILGFARTRELMLKPVSLNSYIEDILMSYPFPAHIEVHKSLAPENPWVNIDHEEMKQAIRNVIGNGVEVMPERGRVTIATAIDPSGESVHIDIGDAGPGIPKDVFEKIFAPFFTTKARGTGLGLAVVKKVVDRHKGKVEVATELGKGTTFRIHIPVFKEPPRPTAA